MKSGMTRFACLLIIVLQIGLFSDAAEAKKRKRKKTIDDRLIRLLKDQGVKPIDTPVFDEELVELGQALFFDPILSGNRDTSCATCHVLVDPAWMSKLPDRDQAELMLLQYAEHYDPERSRLSCQLQLGPELDGMPLTIAPEE